MAFAYTALCKTDLKFMLSLRSTPTLRTIRWQLTHLPTLRPPSFPLLLAWVPDAPAEALAAHKAGTPAPPPAASAAAAEPPPTRKRKVFLSLGVGKVSMLWMVRSISLTAVQWF
jgi:hypothetical protein